MLSRSNDTTDSTFADLHWMKAHKGNLLLSHLHFLLAKKIYNMKSISFANSNWQFLELKRKQGPKPTFCGFSYKPSLLIILLSRKSLIFWQYVVEYIVNISTSQAHHPQIHNIRVHGVHWVKREQTNCIKSLVSMTTSFSNMIGAACDVDGGIWIKAFFGIGGTTLVVRMVKAYLEKQTYWRR